MLIKNFSPQPALHDYVRYYQLVHLVFSCDAIIPFKVFAPRPENCLCFFPADAESLEYKGSDRKDKLSRSTIMGQQLAVTNRHIGRDFLAIRVIFQPGALFRLTGIPANELTNAHVDAESVFCHEIHRVNDRLSSTRNYAELFEIIETFLLQRVRQLKREKHAVDHAGFLILQNSGQHSMDDLANEICLSPRQFIRKFNERMGVSPHVFSRVARFDKSLEMKNNNLSKSWLDIALDCGYYDYQHLVRDYKDFTGLSPTAFLVEDHRSPENELLLIEKNHFRKE
jgi:AraC-like DNA-binding protein